MVEWVRSPSPQLVQPDKENNHHHRFSAELCKKKGSSHLTHFSLASPSNDMACEAETPQHKSGPTFKQKISPSLWINYTLLRRVWVCKFSVKQNENRERRFKWDLWAFRSLWSFHRKFPERLCRICGVRSHSLDLLSLVLSLLKRNFSPSVIEKQFRNDDN